MMDYLTDNHLANDHRSPAPAPRRRIVIKYGGAAMTGPDADESFIRDLLSLRGADADVAVVHGGGSEVTALAARLDVEAGFVDGQRRTDSQTMDIVTMVLAGSVNTRLVRRINTCGGTAVGLSGADGDLLVARRLPEPDLGLVGIVEKVNVRLLELLLDNGFTPVIASIGSGEAGGVYNINADLAAGAVASALGADLLVYMTDVEGVRYGDDLLSTMTPGQARELIRSGVIRGGMIPKVESALQALEGAVREARIVDGRVPGVLQSVLRGDAAGTALIRSQ